MSPTAKSDGQLEELLAFLRTTRGFDFTGYKRPSLARRITKRMGEVGIASYGDYLDYLQVHPDEFTALFNTILINVTSFFRDREAWDYLAESVIPQIVADNSLIRVWSAGCSSGEEAYTLAILFAEATGVEAFCDRVKIYATDVDEEALQTARHAAYPVEALEAVPEPFRERYFQKSGSGVSFRSDLRRALIFGRHDLVQDAPISRIDLIVCRNTLMYLDGDTQSRILGRLYFALKPNGTLFVGKAEMLFSHGQLFTPRSMRHRLFAKASPPRGREALAAFLPPDRAAGDGGPRTFQLRDLAFEVSTLARLLVGADGTLVAANSRARVLFGLASQDVGRPLQDLEVSYRPLELRSRIDEAYAKRGPVTARVDHRGRSGAALWLDVCATPFFENGDRLGVDLSFADVSEIVSLHEEIGVQRQQLETALEELQSANEELETTNEELQSTNEELETTNEELQSTNEELETMNEEMQATNEELDTTNRELQERTRQALDANAFLESILASLESGVVVVDRDLVVETWSDRAEDLWGLRSDEALGHSLVSLDIGLPVEKLHAPLREALTSENTAHPVVLEAINRRGRKIRCRVSFTPRRDAEGALRGVILLLEEWKGAEGED